MCESKISATDNIIADAYKCVTKPQMSFFSLTESLCQTGLNKVKRREWECAFWREHSWRSRVSQPDTKAGFPDTDLFYVFSLNPIDWHSEAHMCYTI